MSPRNQNVPLAESQHHIINPTNPRGALDDGVEDRLHVRGRAADDAEHLGRCRLMLQGLAQFCVALLEFLEQPHVLDGDHGLVGEGFKQLDLLFGKGSNFGAANHDRPNGNTFTQQRRGKNTSETPAACCAVVLPGTRSHLCQDIVNVNRLPVDHGPADYRSTADGDSIHARTG